MARAPSSRPLPSAATPPPGMGSGRGPGAGRKAPTGATHTLGWLPNFGLPRYPRNVYLLLIFTLGKGFQLSIAQVVINLYAYSVGYKQDFIGLLTAAPALGALLAAVPMGLLADRVFRTRRKPLLLITGVLNPLALAAIGLTTSAPIMLVASLANGILSSAYWVTNIPILTESVPAHERVRVMSLNSFLLLGIGAMGGLIGGAVPELVGAILHQPAASAIPLRWGVVVAALAVLLPTAPLAFMQEGQPIHDEQSLVAGPTPLPDAIPAERGALMAAASAPASGASSVGANPAPVKRGMNVLGGRLALPVLFAALLLPDLLFTTGEGAVAGLLQLYFHLRFLLQPGTLGVLAAVAGLLCGVMALLAPPIARRLGKLRAIVAVEVLSAPVMLLIGFAPTLALSVAGEFARNILRGVFEPIYATFAMERVSSRYRATLSGFYSLTWSIGYSIGPATAGWLQLHVSLSASFALGAACLLLAASILYLFFRHTPGVNS
ncbi:MAG TPA: MFS transporter [Ktedonobacterales bacterium]|nr:MFS transporter [Ktedonobacterales bacterium]